MGVKSNAIAAALCTLLVIPTVSFAYKDDIVVANGGGGLAILSGETLSVRAYDSYGNTTALLPLSNGQLLTARSDSIVDIKSGLDLGLIVRDDWGSDPSVQRYANKAIELPNGNIAIAGKSDIPGSQFAMIDIKRVSDLGTIARQDIGYPVIQLGAQSDGDLVVARQDYGPQWVFLDDGNSFNNGTAPPSINIKSMWDPGYPITAMGIQSDGDILFARALTGGTNLILMNGSSLVPPIAVDNWNLITDHIAVLPNDNFVLARADGVVDIRNGGDLSGVARHEFGLGVSALQVLPSGNIAVALSDGSVNIRTGNDLSLLASASGFGSISKMVVQSDGDVVIGSATGGLWVLNGSSLSTIASIAPNGISITQLNVMQGPVVPEPSTVLALSFSLLSFAGLIKRKRQ